MWARHCWIEASSLTLRGMVSTPRSARTVREEVERAVAKTRRPRDWKERASECPIPPAEQLWRGC